jgi:hypothetical protein
MVLIRVQLGLRWGLCAEGDFGGKAIHSPVAELTCSQYLADTRDFKASGGYMFHASRTIRFNGKQMWFNSGMRLDLNFDQSRNLESFC